MWTQPMLSGATRVLLCLTLAGSPASVSVAAADAKAPDSSSIEGLGGALDHARELIKTGDYDSAIETLRGALERAHPHRDALRDAYLLLIKTHVILGNDYKFKPQLRAASDLSYQEARRVIAECLRNRELRHVHPEPASEYPREMITAFAEVRGEIFGSFRVATLDPPDAVVLLDTDTLRTLPGEQSLGDVDLSVGPHVVVVNAPGYKDLTENVSISPNSTLERTYRLTKRKSPAWYAAVGTGAAGVATGLVILLGGKTEITKPPEALPPAPPPP
jgi:hypothetical protein